MLFRLIVSVLLVFFLPVLAAQSSWEFQTDAEGWTAQHDISDLSVVDGTLVVTSTGEDPYLWSAPSLSLAAAATSVFELRMRTTASEGGMLFFLTEGDQTWNGAKSQHFSLLSDGQFHTYMIDMGANPHWKNTITRLRLDPMGAAGSAEIDYLHGLTVQYPHDLLWLETSGYSVGVNLAWGGALSHLLLPDGFNLIDNHDPGRLIQATYYDNKNPHQWNPTQGGDVHQGSPVLVYSVNPSSIYTKTQPRNWIDGILTNTFTEQWVDIVDETTLKIRYRFTYQEPITYYDVPYLPTHELPALWLNKELFRAFSYVDNTPWTFAPILAYDLPYLDQTIPFAPTEDWAGYEDGAGHRLVVYQPETATWIVKRFTTSLPDTTNPSYMSAVGQFALTPGLVHETTVYLFVGSFENIREKLYALADNLVCVPGSIQSCSTGLLGLCAVGEQLCINNTLLSCEQTFFPEFDICDEKDNDCDGEVDETDVDGDGFSACTTDCNDADATVHPSATEVCDDVVDNNCNDNIDEGCSADDCEDNDGDGVRTCDGDCDDTTMLISPLALELCDESDNNCNGQVDEGCSFIPSVSSQSPTTQDDQTIFPQSPLHAFFPNRFVLFSAGGILLLLFFFVIILFILKRKRQRTKQ